MDDFSSTVKQVNEKMLCLSRRPARRPRAVHGWKEGLLLVGRCKHASFAIISLFKSSQKEYHIKNKFAHKQIALCWRFASRDFWWLPCPGLPNRFGCFTHEKLTMSTPRSTAYSQSHDATARIPRSLLITYRLTYRFCLPSQKFIAELAFKFGVTSN